MCTLRFYWRPVYGNNLAYPANKPAEIIAGLMGAKTFTPRQVGEVMALATELGFKVEAVTDPRQPALEHYQELARQAGETGR